MKITRFFIVPVCALFLSLATSPAFASKIGKDCTFKGKKLYGKVQVVDAFPDFRVRVVSAFPDLKVQRSTLLPVPAVAGNGWTPFPISKSSSSNAFSDFDIQYVDAFPGIP